MGSCVNKQKIESSIRQRKVQINSKRQQTLTGLQISSGALKKVKFHHTPLQSCPYLFQKFKNSPSSPQEVNLTFMILNTQIDIEQNRVQVALINQNQMNVYLILGGQQGLSNTGLTVQIADARYVEKINRKTSTLEKGDSISFSPSKIQRDSIMVVMQPVLKVKQSMYLIYRYQYNQKQRKYVKKSQSLQWSNLAFNLQEIYGAQNEFKCNAGEVCSICLSSPSNIIFTPCRHMCVCKDCSKAKDWKICPICRSVVRAIIQYG